MEKGTKDHFMLTTVKRWRQISSLPAGSGNDWQLTYACCKPCSRYVRYNTSPNHHLAEEGEKSSSVSNDEGGLRWMRPRRVLWRYGTGLSRSNHQPLADLMADNFERRVGNLIGSYEMGTSEIEIEAVWSSVDVPRFAGHLRDWAEQVQPLADLVVDNFERWVGNMSGCYERGASETKIEAWWESQHCN